MFNFILCYFTQPKVVLLCKCIKNVNSSVRTANLFNNCSICTISHINCSELCWIASHQWFGSFKRMNMILKWCHDMIFIELRNPVEQCKQETSWILIKSLAYTVNWDMIINKFNFISVCFKWINHELFLITKLKIKITHRNLAYNQSLKRCNECYQK